MKKLWGILIFGNLAISCGGKKEEKKDGFEMNRTKIEAKAVQASEEVPIDLKNKGVGPIKSLSFGPEINTEMAAAGEAKYNGLCTACHLPDERMIGPALKGLYGRRSPEWVMNMILNPNVMLREDPIAIALLKEYNTIMTNQNLSEEDARAIAEYLRTL